MHRRERTTININNKLGEFLKPIPYIGSLFTLASTAISFIRKTGNNFNNLTEIKSNREFIGTLSSNDLNLSPQIIIYPNPASNIINIKLNDGNEFIKAEVYNLVGQKIMEVKNTLFSVENLPDNTYFIKVFSSYGNTMKKFIKN